MRRATLVGLALATLALAACSGSTDGALGADTARPRDGADVEGAPDDAAAPAPDAAAPAPDAAASDLAGPDGRPTADAAADTGGARPDTGPAGCEPGAGVCASASSYRLCVADGSQYGPPFPCDEGTACVDGRCLPLCEADIKTLTNVGCEYWSVDLDNDPIHNPALPNQPTPEMFPHSVVISNPNTGPATVTFSLRVACPDGSPCAPGRATCGGAPGTVCETPAGAPYDLVIADAVVPAGGSREFELPVLNFAGSGIAPKAVRVVSSLPVVAYQFNPFDSENASSNDGSLLLPRNTVGRLYYAVSLPSRGEIRDWAGNPLFPPNNGFVTVVPTVNGTTVQVTPTATVIANPGAGVPQDGSTPETLVAGQTYEFRLNLYDVLNLEQKGELTIIRPGGPPPADLTGTRVEADQPVVVFSGHQVAGVQEADKLQLTDVWDSCCTEHLEEQLMPVETWGTAVDCVKSKPRGYEADRWVVVAGEDGVRLSTTPVVAGLHGVTLARAGDHVRVETRESFVVTGTGKIQVVQFLMSQGQTVPIGQGIGTGDPSMLVVPPRTQYRDEYVILTAGGYGANWTTVVRPAGVEVRLDGAPLYDFEPLGDGTWELAYREVATGSHTFASERPFGLMVYGYGTVTAYGYPGGMRLDP